MIKLTHTLNNVTTAALAEDFKLTRLEDPWNDRMLPSVNTPRRYPLIIANLLCPVYSILRLFKTPLLSATYELAELGQKNRKVKPTGKAANKEQGGLQVLSADEFIWTL